MGKEIKVEIIETGQKFNSIKEAAIWIHDRKGGSLIGIQNRIGRMVNKTKLVNYDSYYSTRKGEWSFYKTTKVVKSVRGYSLRKVK